MFDQQDYYSDEEENLQYSKHIPSEKVLVPNSGSDFNHLTGEGQSLLKMMQDRGLNFNDQELKKLKSSNSNKEKQSNKSKQKAGFLDSGASASLEELLKALNKALSNADPQQASVVLSHILERKNLTPPERNKFGVMKCKILFGLGAYKDCFSNAQALITKVNDDELISASLSNYLAKSRAELGEILEGYMDFQRAKAHLQKYRSITPPIVFNEADEFADSELDTITREIDHTQMEFNIKLSKYKNATNLVFPYFQQFRHRQVLQVVTGDYHTLFLVGGPLGTQTETEVFGLGQNSVGQVLGRSSMDIIKEPTLIVELSGKKIRGLAASRESSCAWDEKGQIYEWGIKQSRDETINITYEVPEKIVQLQKGYQHYAALTASGKIYAWGNIYYKGSSIFKQMKPTAMPGQNIINISCGNSHITAVDSYGDLFMMGSNQYGQLGLEGELHAKSFKKLNSVWLGPVRKSICIADCTFIISKDEQIFFCGKISHNKDHIEKPRQGQFTEDVDYITSIAGTLGNYYLTTASGQLYHWDVDASVKFKIQKQNQKVQQRIVQYSRGSLFKIRNPYVPQLTIIKQKTEKPCSYQDIVFQVELFDKYGPYGSPSYIIPPHCQIFLSTYTIKADDLLKENKQFLESYQLSGDDSKILVNQIVENRLVKFKIDRDIEKPSCHNLAITSEESGKFYFYVVFEHNIVYSKELFIEVSEREQEFSQKNKREKEMKEEERKRKAEMEKQRLLEEKLKKEAEEEEKRRETQRRAEEAYKKHLREQQEQKLKVEEERKARKQLMTGGGFDLSKIKAKNEKYISEKMQVKPELQKSSEFSSSKGFQSFLPDINARPNSRRKINLPTKNSFNATSFDSVRGEKPLRKDEFGGTNLNLFKSESTKEKQVKAMTSSKGVDSLTKPSSVGGKVIVKRGLSKNRK